MPLSGPEDKETRMQTREFGRGLRDTFSLQRGKGETVKNEGTVILRSIADTWQSQFQSYQASKVIHTYNRKSQYLYLRDKRGASTDRKLPPPPRPSTDRDPFPSASKFQVYSVRRHSATSAGTHVLSLQIYSSGRHPSNYCSTVPDNFITIEISGLPSESAPAPSGARGCFK